MKNKNILTLFLITQLTLFCITYSMKSIEKQAIETKQVSPEEKITLEEEREFAKLKTKYPQYKNDNLYVYNLIYNTAMCSETKINTMKDYIAKDPRFVRRFISFGCSPLYYATNATETNLVKFLLQNDARKTINRYQHTVGTHYFPIIHSLFIYGAHKHYKTAALLIEHGAKISQFKQIMQLKMKNGKDFLYAYDYYHAKNKAQLLEGSKNDPKLYNNLLRLAFTSSLIAVLDKKIPIKETPFFTYCTQYIDKKDLTNTFFAELKKNIYAPDMRKMAQEFESLLKSYFAGNMLKEKIFQDIRIYCKNY